jgi:hypothetical protein
MPYLLKGALIEYGSDFLGPIPNAVIFQFNPESLTRNIQITPRPTGAMSHERTQAGEPPTEKMTLTVYFSAADELKDNNALARASGIGPRIAALEKMVYPSGPISGVIGEAIDKIGEIISGGGSENVTQLIPRDTYPRILFIWGITRVLPVIIDSMTIKEQEYDHMLNPVRAEISLGLSVIAPDKCSDDLIGQGAIAYSNSAKDALAIFNLATTASQVVDLIPF